jgi:hypothetical protein
MQLNTLNKRLLEILGLSSDSAQIVIDRIEELKSEIVAQRAEIAALQKAGNDAIGAMEQDQNTIRSLLAEVDRLQGALSSPNTVDVGRAGNGAAPAAQPKSNH